MNPIRLPKEVIAVIAYFIPTRKDFYNFSLISSIYGIVCCSKMIQEMKKSQFLRFKVIAHATPDYKKGIIGYFTDITDTKKICPFINTQAPSFADIGNEINNTCIHFRILNHCENHIYEIDMINYKIKIIKDTDYVMNGLGEIIKEIDYYPDEVEFISLNKIYVRINRNV